MIRSMNAFGMRCWEWKVKGDDMKRRATILSLLVKDFTDENRPVITTLGNGEVLSERMRK